ncbi:hypothetical protein [Photobacterium damselae]|uniref:hypothetical protein n=1 Tax=Photobacterium damselae TaxID=38293 RepID=UPI001F43949D|nr:hypothetical protein [Photobacterium damselae]UKA04550.1 hypothetical protein IHC89_23290 [Photobacterium damselae subsp. damselae]
MCISKTTVTGNQEGIKSQQTCGGEGKRTWTISRSTVEGKLYGVRCVSNTGNGTFEALKAITPNCDIVFHSANMADIAAKMIENYEDSELDSLPISAYIKVGTSAVKIFSGSYEFASVFHSHWQGSAITQNLVIVQSGSTADDFLTDRCNCYNSDKNTLLPSVRELFQRSVNFTDEQRRVNQLRVELASKCIVNKLALEDRGVISTWRKVCEIFEFKGSCVGAVKEKLSGMSVRKTRRGKTVGQKQSVAHQDTLKYFSSDITKFESSKTVDLFAQAKIKQGIFGTEKVAEMDLTSSGLFTEDDKTAVSKRIQREISNINRIKSLPSEFRFKVMHLKETIEIFLLQVIGKDNSVFAAIPLKSVYSAKRMASLISKDFRCNTTPSFSNGSKRVCMSVRHTNGFGRDDSTFFIGNDEQIDYFCDEWDTGAFSSLIAVSYAKRTSPVSPESVKHRVNTTKLSSAFVFAE